MIMMMMNIDDRRCEIFSNVVQFFFGTTTIITSHISIINIKLDREIKEINLINLAIFDAIFGRIYSFFFVCHVEIIFPNRQMAYTERLNKSMPNHRSSSSNFFGQFFLFCFVYFHKIAICLFISLCVCVLRTQHKNEEIFRKLTIINRRVAKKNETKRNEMFYSI